jgi:hypothetical protein
MKVIVIPNTVVASEAIRTKYIEEKAKMTQLRVDNELDKKLKDSLRKMGKSKESMIEEITLFRGADYVIEAEEIVDKEHPDYKQKLAEKKEKIKAEDIEKLNKKSINEIYDIYIDLKLSLQENLEILSKTYDIMIFHCVRLAENPRKKAFDSMDMIDEEITEETKDLLINEHNRINSKRKEEDAKN